MSDLDFGFSFELFGTSKRTLELRGLISALRRGECHWGSFTLERVRAAYSLSPGVNRAVPVPLAEPIRPRRDQRIKVSYFLVFYVVR